MCGVCACQQGKCHVCSLPKAVCHHLAMGGRCYCLTIWTATDICGALHCHCQCIVLGLVCCNSVETHSFAEVSQLGCNVGPFVGHVCVRFVSSVITHE